MKAEELRIGNKVILLPLGLNTETQIYGMRGNNIWVTYAKSETFYIHELKPIKLTEERIIQYGFKYKRERIGTKGVFSNGKLNLILSYGNIFYRKINYPVLYVHQLQNLYFAMIGEELTLKS